MSVPTGPGPAGAGGGDNLGDEPKNMMASREERALLDEQPPTPISQPTPKVPDDDDDDDDSQSSDYSDAADDIESSDADSSKNPEKNKTRNENEARMVAGGNPSINTRTPTGSPTTSNFNLNIDDQITEKGVGHQQRRSRSNSPSSRSPNPIQSSSSSSSNPNHLHPSSSPMKMGNHLKPRVIDTQAHPSPLPPTTPHHASWSQMTKTGRNEWVRVADGRWKGVTTSSSNPALKSLMMSDADKHLVNRPSQSRSNSSTGHPDQSSPLQGFSPRSSSIAISTRLPQRECPTTSSSCQEQAEEPAQTNQHQHQQQQHHQQINSSSSSTQADESTTNITLSSSPTSFTHQSVQNSPKIQSNRSFNQLTPLSNQQDHHHPDRLPLFKSRSDPTSCLDDQHHHHLSASNNPRNNQHKSSMESSQSIDSAHPPSSHILIESSSSSSTQSSSVPSSSAYHLTTSHHTPSSNLPPSTPSSTSSPRQPCAKCRQSMTGQFVRALGTVYHLNCFRCQDCGKVVASKFFPVDSGSPDGRTQYPLCETDYFRRLGLICAKCSGALRGSYITALDMKFHVEHFTCSVCPTVFGPQDSYYEHSGQVYCHFHYSTRFAVKCTGCRTAILNSFYMINKFWNIKLAVSTPSQQSLQPIENDLSQSHDTHSDSNSIDPSSSTAVSTQTVKSSQASDPHPPDSPQNWRQLEIYETAQTLKEKQKQMEEQVYRIWTVLSTFEESSAACISEMLRHVSSGLYLEGVRMAGKFVLHVETLFAAIDDLDVIFRSKNAQEISHVREARMLCKKIVNFFSLLSHTHETGARKMSITKELLSLVTGLAHYLKILIRIALTSALKLEREFSDRNGILQFLSRLDRLARDPDASKATTGPPSAQPDRAGGAPTQTTNPPPSTNGKLRPYGYKSLTRAVGTLVGKGEATTDLCEGCKQTVEEECVRFGTSARWHTACLKCTTCHRPACKSDKPAQLTAVETPNPNLNLNQPPPLYVRRFRADVQVPREGNRLKFVHIFCEECAQTALRAQNPPSISLKEGFESVTRLEQYAFLLCVALNKLYGLLKQRGVLPASADDPRHSHVNGDERSLYDAYRNSTDIKRMKSVDLDRKLSTTARTPQRSTVVESPSGRVAQATGEPQPQNGNGQLRPNDPTIRQPPSRSPVGTRQHQERPRPNVTHPTRERDFTNLPRPTHLPDRLQLTSTPCLPEMAPT
ncbi:hypothetical protein H4Q26_012191 [Puccinia striiformis f. sp. tritici PST-130]|nr:hypothetical protein H4Q26_012191 [Puccinia striiformis f. sp. tritici PST-130]